MILNKQMARSRSLSKRRISFSEIRSTGISAIADSAHKPADASILTYSSTYSEKNLWQGTNPKNARKINNRHFQNSLGNATGAASCTVSFASPATFGSTESFGNGSTVSGSCPSEQAMNHINRVPIGALPRIAAPLY